MADKFDPRKNIFIKLLKFGLDRPDGFTYDEIVSSVPMQSWEIEILRKYLRVAYDNVRIIDGGGSGSIETPFLMTSSFDIYNSNPFSKSYTYIVGYEAQFNYIDYLELKYARETAEEARGFSQKSIKIADQSRNLALFALAATVFMPFVVAFLVTQDVRVVENEHAFLATSPISVKGERGIWPNRLIPEF